jgi:hypothetical protein
MTIRARLMGAGTKRDRPADGACPRGRRAPLRRRQIRRCEDREQGATCSGKHVHGFAPGEIRDERGRTPIRSCGYRAMVCRVRVSRRGAAVSERPCSGGWRGQGGLGVGGGGVDGLAAGRGRAMAVATGQEPPRTR